MLEAAKISLSTTALMKAKWGRFPHPKTARDRYFGYAVSTNTD